MIDNKHLILGLLEKNLGKSTPSTDDDHVFYCPVCNHKKKKLVVNISTGLYNCWTCNPSTKGRSPVSLFKKLKVSQEDIQEMSKYFKQSAKEQHIDEIPEVSFPKEIKDFIDDETSSIKRQALSYLKSRGITNDDIIKYNIKYCESGKYKNRVIIPSYSQDGLLNYFVARSLDIDAFLKYDAPKSKKTEIIGFENLINFKVPIILCEGVFDAIAFKRNAIPLFGKTISKKLMKKLVESEVKTIYLALDKDAYKQCLAYAEQLLNMGKEIYLLDMTGKDPSEIGFEDLTKMLHTAKQLSFQELIIRKLMRI